MPFTNLSRQWSYAYLLAVPVLVTALAFIVGHVPYTLLIPYLIAVNLLRKRPWVGSPFQDSVTRGINTN